MPHDWPVGDNDPAGDADDAADGPACDRCGATVSHAFRRQWRDNDGRLDGCPECLPRSMRFGKDVYDRDAADVEDFDKDKPNAGKDPAPSHRLLDEIESDGSDE